jgi:hypothetical protein
MKLTAIDTIGEGRVLVEVVEKLQNRLVANQQAKQTLVAMAGDSPEQRRTIDMGTLANERVQRNFARCCIGYGPCL